MVLPSQVRVVLGRPAARCMWASQGSLVTGPVESGWGVGRTGRGAGGGAEGRAAPEFRPLVCRCLRGLAGGPVGRCRVSSRCPGGPPPQLAPLAGWSGRKAVAVAWP